MDVKHFHTKVHVTQSSLKSSKKEKISELHFKIWGHLYLLGFKLQQEQRVHRKPVSNWGYNYYRMRVKTFSYIHAMEGIKTVVGTSTGKITTPPLKKYIQAKWGFHRVHIHSALFNFFSKALSFFTIHICTTYWLISGHAALLSKYLQWRCCEAH